MNKRFINILGADNGKGTYYLPSTFACLYTRCRNREGRTVREDKGHLSPIGQYILIAYVGVEL